MRKLVTCSQSQHTVQSMVSAHWVVSAACWLNPSLMTGITDVAPPISLQVLLQLWCRSVASCLLHVVTCSLLVLTVNFYPSCEWCLNVELLCRRAELCVCVRDRWLCLLLLPWDGRRVHQLWQSTVALFKNNLNYFISLWRSAVFGRFFKIIFMLLWYRSRTMQCTSLLSVSSRCPGDTAKFYLIHLLPFIGE